MSEPGMISAALERAVALAGSLEGDPFGTGELVGAGELLLQFQAALHEARRLEGNRRPVLNSVEAFARLRAYVRKHKSASAAAGALGISRGFLADILSARRPIPPGVCSAIGIERKQQRREVYEEV